MKKNFLMNLFYQKNLSLYFIGLLIFGLTLTFNFNVKAQVRDGGISATDKICNFGDDFDEDQVANKPTYYCNSYSKTCGTWEDPFKGEPTEKKVITRETDDIKDDLIKEKSCFWKNNCKEEVNTGVDKTLYCMGENKVTGKEVPNSFLIECSNSNLQTRELYDVKNNYPTYSLKKDTYSEFFLAKPGDYKIEYTLEYIEYKPKIPTGCTICEKDGRKSNRFEDCPSGKSLETTCKFDVGNKTCSFGQTNTDCASDVSKSVRPRETRLGNTYTYFCNKNSQVIECKGDKTLQTYTDIFNADLIGINDEGKKDCKPYTSAISSEGCKLAKNNNTYCNFGPSNTSNPGDEKNCAENNENYESRGKFYYCGPNNIKVECDRAITYNNLFEPSQYYNEEYITIYDYSGKKISSAAERDYGCKIFNNAPSAGCSVKKESVVGENCTIPKDCFNSSDQPVATTIAGTVGGLYCISKITSAIENTGTVHFCQANYNAPRYNLKSYSEISEITTKNGVENVYFKSGSQAICFTTPDIPVELTKVNPLSPINLIKTISSTLYYFAIFYFIVLILTNAFSYIRSGEDPSKLKQVTESLFNTIAGFIFVLASGGVIIYIINQLTQR